jgi:hypothetical protein
MRSPIIHHPRLSHPRLSHPRLRHPHAWVREHFDAWFDRHVARRYRQLEEAEHDAYWEGK